MLPSFLSAFSLARPPRNHRTFTPSSLSHALLKSPSSPLLPAVAPLLLLLLFLSLRRSQRQPSPSLLLSPSPSLFPLTSLMYKLHQLMPKRENFRLTIFPGPVDRALVAALIVIFLD
nr:uncharacterized protein LOC114821082 [Malus domestica]